MNKWWQYNHSSCRRHLLSLVLYNICIQHRPTRFLSLMSRPWSVKWELAAKYSCFIWAQSIQLHLMEIIERIKCVLLCGCVYLCLSKECPPFYLDWAFIALSTELFVHSEKTKKTCSYSDVKCCSSISSAIVSGALKSAQTDLRSAQESRPALLGCNLSYRLISTVTFCLRPQRSVSIC